MGIPNTKQKQTINKDIMVQLQPSFEKVKIVFFNMVVNASGFKLSIINMICLTLFHNVLRTD